MKKTSKREIQKIMEEMTIEEKASMCIGGDFWHTRAIERLGIPAVMLTDGSFGLRKQSGKSDHLGLHESNVAIAYPSGVNMASSFDPQLAKVVGGEIGKLCQMENVSVILGPAMNIKRSPLCGRNFEYYSEDPVVSSEIASGIIEGIQQEGVGACPKHFLANNQEHFRQTSNSVVDERTLRELYLASFEGAVKKANPWTMMCSYNQINGTYACENKRFLTDILRDEWGFTGYVMTDWGALDNPAESIAAGLDLGMPGPAPDNANRIAEAVKSGNLDEKILNQAVERILAILFRYVDNHREDAAYDFNEGHDVARIAAEESAVLLKNEEQILPLCEEEKVLFIGDFAKNPRYQGGGSSHINPYRVSNVWDTVKDNKNVMYMETSILTKEIVNCDKVNSSVRENVQSAQKVVIFAGLPESCETEGLDRLHMRLPDTQNQLIEAVASVTDNVIVVLHNGSPVEMPWLPKVKAVLEVYLGGEAVGEATANLLYGKANPSGRLAETLPIRMEDNPTYPYFGVERQDVVYREGILVGYRYYETMKKEVLFPFGHGLSYTDFTYSNLTLSTTDMNDTDTLEAQVTVKNTGAATGKEVVQLYVSGKTTGLVRPERELRVFQKISLAPGEAQTVKFQLSKRDFAYWNTDISDWYVSTGKYKIQIGKSVADIVLEDVVRVKSTTVLRPHFTLNSALGDLMANPIAFGVLKLAMGPMMERAAGSSKKKEEQEGGALTEEATTTTAAAMPLRALISFGDRVTAAGLQKILDEINEAIQRDSI